MRFLQLLPFASLSLAIPNRNSRTKRQTSCTSEPWAIQQYHTCTNCTYPGSTQETTSLVFNFADPNFNPAVTAMCELSLLPGSSLIDFNYTPCGSGVAFYYDGADLNVERTGVECGNHTYTYSGAEVTVRFEKGVPVKVSSEGKEWTDSLDLFNALNTIGKKHGFGRIDIDSPAMPILRWAHLDLEGLSLMVGSEVFATNLLPTLDQDLIQWTLFEPRKRVRREQPSLLSAARRADKPANLARARSRVLEASRAGASLIVLPECFNSPYGCQYFPSYAETLQPSPPTREQSPSFHALAELAVESGSYLLGGSIPEYVASTEKYHNTSLLFSPAGDLLATHRKVHLFDIDIPGKITFRESDVLSPGNKLTLVDIPPYGKIALAICYDIRFPELATIAARKGCFLLLYPGAFNLTTGALHWELQARARAVDNQVYVGLCSPARDMEATYNAWGHSMVVDPNASVMCEAGEAEEIVYADLNGEKIEETRKGIPIYTQRRFDVYPDVGEGKIKFDE
ncbi:MAG: hypothetical protein ASARMPREDX12_000491 [Alectoria sarmentosa]|nr:MAG: hypothetical protein ASARMPREDX12_000491 [Alectoria sarmentosa]